MRLVVTGVHGQVVRALVERAPAGVTVVALGRPDLDLADAPAIAPALAAVGADVVINAAAYTAVDKAETERDAAFAINATGAGAVAAAAHGLGVPLIHVSTDYVFDGAKPAPYVETDPTGPTGVYGASKLAGEAAVMAAHPGAVIARTAWVYSPFGANFVKTMLRLAATREELGVVADQVGNPTSALDIADGLLQIAANLQARPADPALAGLFHMTGSGEASWAGFAEAVFAASAAHGGPVARVNPIATTQYPTPARRPANSRLDCTRLATVHGVRLPDWRGSVEQIVARLLAAEETIA
ncbi:dTDP-4-dehydrorhamnose reductase [Novosphingobium sp. FSW06-99]|uniref:dTDP-4-dehydrorhamnose reductase n=1 Tax=Novosphingobium sp. FSW06-99 TaxID=1739113 RepID=UPI00076C4FCC|nr:dTDP-4-dehydrorhamnose reductase [Novosphingobium sp. FSW06-99]KUR75715.1 dTDP-4-dehydrorhamnose reductase [Novosphingobium sp. FSW06-99]